MRSGSFSNHVVKESVLRRVSTALMLKFCEFCSHMDRVLNEQGKLVANLSASDIRLIASKPRNERLKPSAILYLLRPIEEYLRQDTDLTDLRPFRVSKSLDMSKVYKIMLDAYVSRVWVVDENDKPVGVVTRRDLLDLVSLSKGTRKEE